MRAHDACARPTIVLTRTALTVMGPVHAAPTHMHAPDCYPVLLASDVLVAACKANVKFAVKLCCTVSSASAGIMMPSNVHTSLGVIDTLHSSAHYMTSRRDCHSAWS
jgi:hypothetical protein